MAATGGHHRQQARPDPRTRYRVVWFPLSEGEQAQREIVVSNPMALPLMPGEKERGPVR